MENMTIGEWVALYGALLSTSLAVVGFLKWLMSGPRLAVTVFNPREIDFGSSDAFLAIVANAGSVATVVRVLEVSFRTSRWPGGKEVGKARFDEKSNWKPSVKLVPTERPNTSRPEPNILLPGAELRAPALPVREYDPTRHWIKVTAYARSRRRGFIGWAAPVPVVADGKVD